MENGQRPEYIREILEKDRKAYDSSFESRVRGYIIAALVGTALVMSPLAIREGCRMVKERGLTGAKKAEPGHRD